MVRCHSAKDLSTRSLFSDFAAFCSENRIGLDSDVLDSIKTRYLQNREVSLLVLPMDKLGDTKLHTSKPSENFRNTRSKLFLELAHVLQHQYAQTIDFSQVPVLTLPQNQNDRLRLYAALYVLLRTRIPLGSWPSTDHAQLQDQARLLVLDLYPEAIMVYAALRSTRDLSLAQFSLYRSSTQMIPQT